MEAYDKTVEQSMRLLFESLSEIGVGKADWFRPPLPPNRTGGSPASGSPVNGSP